MVARAERARVGRAQPRGRAAGCSAKPQAPLSIAGYLESVLESGDLRALPIALRTVAEAMGGMTALAARTGLSRETLYRTLSEKGNPRLDTLTAILTAFGLRLAVAPASANHAADPRAATGC
ncbi:addiction module antidote protein [Luteimonas qiangzhengi]|uniref:addiction module antidote protein n=1 Tax=Luteimonas sp. MJ146 TaxID=3129240 RepID=UPI0031BAF586